MKQFLFTGFILLGVIYPIGMTHAQDEGDSGSIAEEACWE